MIAQVKDKRFIAQGVEQFGKLFTVASTSRISLSEMGKAQKILIAQGIEKSKAETLWIPYEETLVLLTKMEDIMTAIKTLDKKAKELFGKHTTHLLSLLPIPRYGEHHDYRRINIMNGAVGLLKKKTDIINYIDIY